MLLKNNNLIIIIILIILILNTQAIITYNIPSSSSTANDIYQNITENQNNISLLWLNASNQDDRIITLEAGGGGGVSDEARPLFDIINGWITTNSSINNGNLNITGDLQLGRSGGLVLNGSETSLIYHQTLDYIVIDDNLNVSGDVCLSSGICMEEMGTGKFCSSNQYMDGWNYNGITCGTPTVNTDSYSDSAWINNNDGTISNISINKGNIIISGNLTILNNTEQQLKIQNINGAITLMSVGSPALRFTSIVDNPIFQIWGTKDNVEQVQLHFRPDNNASRDVRLKVFSNINNQYGLVLETDSSDKMFIPKTTKEYNLGSSSYSWDNCYCDDYITTSRGWIKPTNKTALNVVNTIYTNPITGEIDHSLQDNSLNDESGKAISLNAMILVQSEAIKELEKEIESLKKLMIKTSLITKENLDYEKTIYDDTKYKPIFTTTTTLDGSTSSTTSDI